MRADNASQMLWLMLILGAYLVGSIPFGVLIARMKGVDIRQHGSRNIGATNVGRVLGRRLGMLCFALDALKGAVPVLAAGWATNVLGHTAGQIETSAMWLWLLVAIAAVIGHMHSIFLRFGGGKGVATAAGAMLAMWPVLTVPAAIAIVVWILIVKLARFVSLASMCAAVTVPLVVIALAIFGPDSFSEVNGAAGLGHRLLDRLPLLIVTGALAALVIYRHRANIGRLLRGTEPPTGRKRSA